MSTSESDSRLNDALSALQQRMQQASLEGTPDASLVRREAELRRPIPGPIRMLFQAMSPGDWERAVSGIELLPLDETDWVSDDEGGSYFCFANGIFGDPVLICERAPAHAPGSIVLADHEAGGELIVLESDLATWLERLVAFGGHEYGYMNGELPSIPADLARRFLQRHLTLNPNSEWAARALKQLDG